jgi:tRNA A58 N-methylase Trm61
MKPYKPENEQLVFHPMDSDAYVQEVQRTTEKYHMIIVDGRRRSECIRASASALKEEGVLVLDNSERTQYQEAITTLTEKGYKRLDFWGIAPVAANNTCTSVFYKSENCIGV